MVLVVIGILASFGGQGRAKNGLLSVLDFRERGCTLPPSIDNEGDPR